MSVFEPTVILDTKEKFDIGQFKDLRDSDNIMFSKLGNLVIHLFFTLPITYSLLRLKMNQPVYIV